MELLGGSQAMMCPRDEQCSAWARDYLKYCICSTKDGVSLALGVVSVLSWGFAEVPQLLTNYREKSSEGLSLAFLLTWILGDLFNLSGCMLEPATIPTQYYMAILYTLTTSVLTLQTIYYEHIYHRLKRSRRCQKGSTPFKNESVGEKILGNNGVNDNNDRWGQRTDIFVPGATPSSPIPLPALPRYNSSERELYYTSARSLSRSHTPTMGSLLAQRRTQTSFYEQNLIEEPLLGGVAPKKSLPLASTKPLFCVVSALTFFLGSLNLHQRENNRLRNLVSGEPYKGVVVHLGRKLLQVSDSLLQETGTGSSGIGTFLGWGMAVIYMGGRFPQIFLNFRRGNVEGLNPLMFIFALVGNITYVASILVSSLNWSKIKPNLPWLVDAGGCVVLDTFILFQFIYFHYHTSEDPKAKHGTPSDEYITEN